MLDEHATKLDLLFVIMVTRKTITSKYEKNEWIFPKSSESSESN